jgi:hypothetical protein
VNPKLAAHPIAGAAATARAKRARVNESAKKPKKPRKFEENSEPYTISPETWKRIGNDMVNSASTYPHAFGDKIASIFENCHNFKASDWRRWCHEWGPIYLKGALPTEFYARLMDLFKAIGLATERSLKREDIKKVHHLIVKFLRHYEKEYYRYEYARVRTWHPVYHHLLHVADSLEWFGPTCLYWQFLCERVCGVLVAAVSNLYYFLIDYILISVMHLHVA